MGRTGFAIVMLAAGAPAFAATQGSTGPRSSASILITASVAAQARLVGGAATPCVALNTATQGFHVEADPAAEVARCGEAGAHTGLVHARPDGTLSLVVAPE